MGQTVIQILERTAREHGWRAAMKVKRNGRWETYTWDGYRETVRRMARGFIALGLEPGGGVVIIGFNRPEWFLADLGAIAAGALPIGIYTTSTADQCRYISDHCSAAIAVVENHEQLEKFLHIRSRLPSLGAIVLMEGEHGDPMVHSWQELLKLADRTPESELDRRCDNLREEDPCTLIYTSGTTGSPKGVTLTHHNIVWVVDRLSRTFDFRAGEDVLSYLPLSHIAEQVVSLHTPLSIGACTWFAESLEKLGENLREVRPHFFFAVPRVWEKIQARVEAVGIQASWLRRTIASWARRQGLAGGLAEQRGGRKPLLYGLADWLVFSKVRERLGLDRARACVTSSAPISTQTLEFFLSLGIPLLEVYGMSECTGPTTFSTSDRYRSGSAGWAIPGTELTIAEDGEILIRGPHVFPGYFRDPVATAEALDAEGWLYSGDIGEIDADGFLRVTDRKKELIITSGGKNVAPQPIEGKLRSIPSVSGAALVGDRRNYLVALLTLDPERLPTEAARAGSSATDPASAAECPLFRRHLESQVQEVNASLPSYETIKRFAILPGQFTSEGGELTPSLKLKRRVILEKYAARIEALYA